MLTDEQISVLLKDIEADNVERTISTTKTDKFCQAICAIANDMPDHGKPGYLFIGADDKTGKIAGIEITDQLLQNLAGYRDAGQIVPLPSLTVQKRSFPEGDIAVVEVHLRYAAGSLQRAGLDTSGATSGNCHGTGRTNTHRASGAQGQNI